MEAPGALAAVTAGLLGLALIGALAQLAFAGRQQVVADLIEARLVALALDLRDVRGGEGELQLLGGQIQIATGDLVLTHVVIGIARVAGGHYEIQGRRFVPRRV